jgi:hypothetical protein
MNDLKEKMEDLKSVLGKKEFFGQGADVNNTYFLVR